MEADEWGEEVFCIVPDSVREAPLATIAIINGRMGTNWVDTAVLSRSPGVYTLDGSGRGPVLERAVMPGESVEISATGLDPEGETVVSVDETDVRADSVEADAERPGIFRVKFSVPAGIRAGTVPLFLLSGGRASQPDVRLEVAAQ